jgi:hypothetical protein
MIAASQLVTSESHVTLRALEVDTEDKTARFNTTQSLFIDANSYHNLEFCIRPDQLQPYFPIIIGIQSLLSVIQFNSSTTSMRTSVLSA